MRGLVARGVFSSAAVDAVVSDETLVLATLLLRSSETFTLFVLTFALFDVTSTVTSASTPSFSFLERLRLLGVTPRVVLAVLLLDRFRVLGVAPLTVRLRLLGVAPLTVVLAVLFSLFGVAVEFSCDEFTEIRHKYASGPSTTTFTLRMSHPNDGSTNTLGTHENCY